MNLVGIVLVVLCLSQSLEAAPTPCELLNGKDKICNETEYEAYRNCIEETKLVREKREAAGPCPLLVVEPVVQTAEPLEMLVPVQAVKVIKKPDLKNLDRTIIVSPGQQFEDDADDEETGFHYRFPMNVTTVIRLTNIVNNTNHISMPTTLNNTNVNNIHIYSNLTEVGQGDDDEPKESCCTAVLPQSCHTSTQGVRCKHRKFHTCGPQCTANVVHIQKRKRCHRSTGECQEKIAYVPQPEKPTCVYVDEWPYVVCGKVANMSVICAGCYDHYGYGYQAVHGHAKMQPQCYGCYDDAFDVGPRYRRGPVLRPFYYHQAPCYLTGSCPDSYENCGYGCYGHDRVDPAWGQPNDEQFDPSMGPPNTIYYNPDELDVTNEESYDWGVPTAKCAVATDGNTITVKNCTDSIDNPYMAAPATNPHYKQLIPGSKKPVTTSAPNAVTPTTPGAEPTKAEGTSAPTKTSSTHAPEVKEVTKTTTTEALTTLDDVGSENENNDVDGSGDGMLNDVVYFAEEYVDDEDYTL